MSCSRRPGPLGRPFPLLRKFIGRRVFHCRSSGGAGRRREPYHDDPDGVRARTSSDISEESVPPRGRPVVIAVVWVVQRILADMNVAETSEGVLDAGPVGGRHRLRRFRIAPRRGILECDDGHSPEVADGHHDAGRLSRTVSGISIRPSSAVSCMRSSCLQEQENSSSMARRGV